VNVKGGEVQESVKGTARLSGGGGWAGGRAGEGAGGMSGWMGDPMAWNTKSRLRTVIGWLVGAHSRRQAPI